MGFTGNSHLNYTFLTNNEPLSLRQDGVYVPLIIPNFVADTFNAQLDAEFDALTEEVGDILGTPLTDTSEFELEFENEIKGDNAPPFSTIKNFHINAINKGDFTNLKYQFIDVVKDFRWTASPQTSKTGTSEYDLTRINDEVPHVILKEKYFLFNNLIAQALYTLTAANQTAQSFTGTDVSSAVASTFQEFGGLQRLQSELQGASSTALTFGSEIANFLREQGNNFIDFVSIGNENPNQDAAALDNIQLQIKNQIIKLGQASGLIVEPGGSQFRRDGETAKISQEEAETIIGNAVANARASGQNAVQVAANIANIIITEVDNFTSAALKFAKSSVGTLTENFFNEIKAITKYVNPDLERVMFPYQGLYFLGPTGFKYKFPYLNNTILNANNDFGGDRNQLGPINALTDLGTNAVEGLSQFLTTFSQAGTSSIERTKYYNFADTGEEINLTVPLYNTQPSTFSDVVSNFRLIFLLLYQNLPQRQDKNIVEPPAIYDLTIPGGRREPYCFISSITVVHNGNTRMMDIPMDGLSVIGDSELPETVKAIIPDSYLLKITFAPLIGHTKNMLYSTISKDGINKIIGREE